MHAKPIKCHKPLLRLSRRPVAPFVLGACSSEGGTKAPGTRRLAGGGEVRKGLDGGGGGDVGGGGEGLGEGGDSGGGGEGLGGGGDGGGGGGGGGGWLGGGGDGGGGGGGLGGGGDGGGGGEGLGGGGDMGGGGEEGVSFCIGGVSMMFSVFFVSKNSLCMKAAPIPVAKLTPSVTVSA